MAACTIVSSEYIPLGALGLEIIKGTCGASQDYLKTQSVTSPFAAFAFPAETLSASTDTIQPKFIEGMDGSTAYNYQLLLTSGGQTNMDFVLLVFGY